LNELIIFIIIWCFNDCGYILIIITGLIMYIVFIVNIFYEDNDENNIRDKLIYKYFIWLCILVNNIIIYI